MFMNWMLLLGFAALSLPQLLGVSMKDNLPISDGRIGLRHKVASNVVRASLSLFQPTESSVIRRLLWVLLLVFLRTCVVVFIDCGLVTTFAEQTSYLRGLC